MGGTSCGIHPGDGAEPDTFYARNRSGSQSAASTPATTRKPTPFHEGDRIGGTSCRIHPGDRAKPDTFYARDPSGSQSAASTPATTQNPTPFHEGDRIGGTSCRIHPGDRARRATESSGRSNRDTAAAGPAGAQNTPQLLRGRMA